MGVHWWVRGAAGLSSIRHQISAPASCVLPLAALTQVRKMNFRVILRIGGLGFPGPGPGAAFLSRLFNQQAGFLEPAFAVNTPSRLSGCSENTNTSG